MTCLWMLLLFLIPGAALATDYYATPSGGSSSASSCPTTAPCTAGRAMSLAQAGDSVIFKNGTYSFQLATVRNGTSSAPIRIRAENRRQAIFQFPSNPSGGKPRLVSIEHDWIILSGLRLRGSPFENDTLRIGGSHSGSNVNWAENIIVEDMQMENSGGGGTNMHDTRNVTYRYSEINKTSTKPPNASSPGGTAFYMGSASAGSKVDNVVAHNNLIRDVRGHNLVDYKNGTTNIRFYNNLFDGHFRGTDGGRADGLIRSVAKDGVPDANHIFRDSIVRNMEGCFYVIRTEKEVDTTNNVFYDITDCGSVFIHENTSSLSAVSGNITCAPMPTTEQVNRGSNSHNQPMSSCISRVEAIVGVPAIASCEIGGVNDTTVTVNITTAIHPPVSSVGALQVTYDGVNQTENSVTLPSGNQARIVMASQPSSSGVTVRVVAADGLIKNSAFIGGKVCGTNHNNLILGQAVCGENKAQTIICQNTTGGTPQPNELLSQSVSRFYAAHGAEGESPLAPENGGVTLSLGSGFRWRVGVRGGGNDAISRSYALASRLCNPTCGNWSVVSDDPAVTGVVFSDDEIQVHLTPTTNRLSIGGRIFLPGVFLEEPGNTPAVAIQATQQVEWEFSLALADSGGTVDAGDQIQLRMQHDDGTALPSYSALPSITIGSASSGMTGSFSGGVIQ